MDKRSRWEHTQAKLERAIEACESEEDRRELKWRLEQLFKIKALIFGPGPAFKTRTRHE